MNRRSDPDRLASARWTGLRSRLVDAWAMTPESADSLLEAWRLEAAVRSLTARDPGYWAAAEEWLRQRRRP